MVHRKVKKENQKVSLVSGRWQLTLPKGWGESHPLKALVLWMLRWVASKVRLLVTGRETRTTESGEITYPSGWTARVVCPQQAGLAYQPVDSRGAAPLIEAYPDAPLSRHFRLSEFRAGEPGYQYLRVSPELVQLLELIRERAGTPLRVTSGYRPQRYNRQVGGASSSAHTDGIAVDIEADGLSTEELYRICDYTLGERGGVGFYPGAGFVHLDLRGYHARWRG